MAEVSHIVFQPIYWFACFCSQLVCLRNCIHLIAIIPLQFCIDEHSHKQVWCYIAQSSFIPHILCWSKAERLFLWTSGSFVSCMVNFSCNWFEADWVATAVSGFSLFHAILESTKYNSICSMSIFDKYDMIWSVSFVILLISFWSEHRWNKCFLFWQLASFLVFPSSEDHRCNDALRLFWYRHRN